MICFMSLGGSLLEGGGHWVQQNEEKVNYCSSKNKHTIVPTQLVGTKGPPLTGQIANHTYDNVSTLVVASQNSEGTFTAA